MEIEGEDGSKIELKAGSNAMFGRGSGFNTNDRTVSRQHVLFQLENQPESPHRVSFEVLGKNPIWVRSTELGNGINVFKKSEKGEVVIGDGFCISSQNPVWFTVKGVGDSVEKRVLESESGSELGGDLEEVDVCGIDPVKEFGFLVVGHEFDSYPKIRNVKDWDWFLEESEAEGDDSEDDGNEKRARKGKGKRKRNKRVGGNEEDDDWTGESEDDKQVVARISKVGRPKYMTRSKGLNQTHEKAKRKRTSGTKREYPNEEDNDEDETLGGFIVDDDEDIDDQIEENDEFEEEEFLDDEEQDE